MNGRLRMLCVASLLATLPESAAAKDRTPPRITYDVIVACPAEEAWKAWTTAKGLESFLARKAQVDLRVGGAYVIQFGPKEVQLPREPRILQLDVPHTISFEWIIPLPNATARDPMTVVSVQVESVSGERCKVHLEHTGWSDRDRETEDFRYSRQSWKVVLESLRTALTKRGQVEPTGGTVERF